MDVLFERHWDPQAHPRGNSGHKGRFTRKGGTSNTTKAPEENTLEFHSKKMREYAEKFVSGEHKGLSPKYWEHHKAFYKHPDAKAAEDAAKVRNVGAQAPDNYKLANHWHRAAYAHERVQNNLAPELRDKEHQAPLDDEAAARKLIRQHAIKISHHLRKAATLGIKHKDYEYHIKELGKHQDSHKEHRENLEKILKKKMLQAQAKGSKPTNPKVYGLQQHKLDQERLQAAHEKPNSGQPAVTANKVPVAPKSTSTNTGATAHDSFKTATQHQQKISLMQKLKFHLRRIFHDPTGEKRKKAIFRVKPKSS